MLGLLNSTDTLTYSGLLTMHDTTSILRGFLILLIHLIFLDYYYTLIQFPVLGLSSDLLDYVIQGLI
jgi:hypothetical protein